MNLLLSEDLPLRTTRALGKNYAVDQVLPHRYGDLTEARFALLKLDDSRWFAADHPTIITSVFIDDQETLGWSRVVESDGAGNSWTEVHLAAPAPDSAKVSACGFGKSSVVTGALIENPADVFQDIMRIGGRETSWPRLRAECAAEGLLVAGSLAERVTIRDALDDVAKSVGAIWIPSDATLYPVSTVTGFVLDLESADADNVRVTTNLDDTADILRVGYGLEQATGRPLKSMEFTASPMLLGGIAAELSLPWLRSAADAEQVGTRLLERMAGERYRVAFSSRRSEIKPGWWVRLKNLPDWPFDHDEDPVVKVTETEVDLLSDSVEVVAEFLRAIPVVSVSSFSVALPSTVQGAVDASYRNGVATFRVLDPDRRPLSGARVSLDGGPPKTTDAQGIVTFVTTKGRHTLAVEAPGFAGEELEVTL